MWSELTINKTYFTSPEPCSGVSNVNFEQVNAHWAVELCYDFYCRLAYSFFQWFIFFGIYFRSIIVVIVNHTTLMKAYILQISFNFISLLISI